MKFAGITLILNTLLGSSQAAPNESRRLRTREVYKSHTHSTNDRRRLQNENVPNNIPIVSLSFSIELDIPGGEEINAVGYPPVNDTGTPPTLGIDTATMPTPLTSATPSKNDTTTESSSQAEVVDDDDDGTPPSCPETLPNIELIDEKAIMYYAVVPSNPPEANNGILCARLEVDNEGQGWVGFGISTDGKMDESQAVIGLPNDDGISGDVKKYWLSKGEQRITKMEDEKQTLLGTAMTQEAGGLTTMSFVKLLVEEGDDEIPILENGENIFLHARGEWNWPGYHKARLSFTKDFSLDAPPALPGVILEPGPVILPEENSTTTTTVAPPPTGEPEDTTITITTTTVAPEEEEYDPFLGLGSMSMPAASTSTAPTQPDAPPLGGDYCTWGPDYECYESGWPSCCASQDCPDESPLCDETPSTTIATTVPVVNDTELSSSPPSATECEFCLDGIVSADVVITISEDGNAVTCGVTSQYATTLEGGTDECTTLKLVEISCCPGSVLDVNVEWETTPTLDQVFQSSPTQSPGAGKAIDGGTSSSVRMGVSSLVVVSVALGGWILL